MKADLRAGFGSFKFIPMPIVLSINNANPKLILHEFEIEYRGGFVTRKMMYQDIEQIHVYFFRDTTNNLIISKKTGISTFIGNFRTRTQLREFLSVLKAKGCKLTYKAEMEIQIVTGDT